RVPRRPSSTVFPYTTLFRSARRRDALAEQRWVVGRLEDRARADRQRRAARVQIEERVAARKDLVADEGRDLLGDAATRIAGKGRSEEHTSELQSPYDLVCRL